MQYTRNYVNVLSWGRGASFFSCGYPVSSALFPGESIFSLLLCSVDFSEARRVCVGLLAGSVLCSARAFAAGGPVPPSPPCWGFDLQQVGCFLAVFSFSVSAVFAFWLLCDVQSQLTNFNKNACWDCD